MQAIVSGKVSRIITLVSVIVALAMSIGFLISNSEAAKAIPLDNGGTLDVRVTGYSPTAPDTQLCAGGRNKPNFTAYFDTGSPPSLIVDQGGGDTQISFTFFVAWRDCDRPTDGYALFSGKYCPTSGYYGGDNTAPSYEVNDCIKYIESTPRNSTNDNFQLGCPYLGPSAKRPGQPCTTAGARANNQFIPVVTNNSALNTFNRAGPQSATPSSVGQVLRIPYTTSLGRPNPSMSTRSSGTGSYDGQICQYFWFDNQSAAQSQNDECRQLVINYEWTYTPPPSYTLSATVSGVKSNFTYEHSLPDPWYWGMQVDAAANLPAEGIGNHNIDVWRVIYPGAPSDGWAEGVITNGDTGLCNALSGYSSCDRIGAYPCVNAVYGCNPLNAAGQFWRWVFDEEIGPYPVGTQVCYISRVSKPTYTSSQDDWKGSVRTCSVSGVTPKVQAWGYDTKATGRIKTSLTDVDDRRYGSWGEYGVLSNGTNQSMASGGGLLGGVPSGIPQSSWSPLTFANDPANAFSCSGGFGCYGGVTMPNVSVQGGVTAPGGGDYTVTSYGQLAGLLGGSKGKLRVNGTLFISGDLVYPDSTTGIAGIPKIELIANDIVINSNVRQIDPWVIALGTTGTNGRVSTCDQARQGTNYFVQMTSANLYGGPSGICGNPLKFNSPIIADKVYLYRTYDEQNGATAAETLNVRADNFLSSYVGGGTDQPVATTDSVVELPPRF